MNIDEELDKAIKTARLSLNKTRSARSSDSAYSAIYAAIYSADSESSRESVYWTSRAARSASMSDKEERKNQLEMVKGML